MLQVVVLGVENLIKFLSQNLEKEETGYWLGSRLVGHPAAVNQVQECKAKLQSRKYETGERK